MKNCNHCGTEFEPHQTRGHEQLYCSLACRNKAAIQRKEEKIKQQYESKYQKTENGNSDNNQSLDRGPVGEITRIADRERSITDSHLATIKELYEAKNETILYKLKCEALERENQELKAEIFKLEEELSEMDEEPENDYSSILGGVMTQFKQDPVNTMNFATELISNLFKPKK
jgi:hypothetical protein